MNVAPAEPPAIPISQPVERQVTDFVDFTGRIEAPQAVSVVPRVTGYLVNTPFKEGAEVKKDDVLFEIDSRPYQAQYDQAAGQVLLNEARVKEAMADNARAKELGKTPGAISKQDLDRYQAAEEEAEASVQAAKASLEVYNLNLGFCQVKSPITGQISRYYLTPGNLVNQDQTQLTTVVSVDPMYVYFDIDENTVLRVRRAVNEGKILRYQQGEIPVFIGLEGEEGYPHEGTINFVNNQVNPGTGSITVRGVVSNAKPANGVRLLSPGMFVRVRLPIGQPHDALLVIDRAIGSDQGMKYVYLVDDKNIVQQQRVETGALEEDGLRVIDSGLKAGEWVVIGGIQQVRPRMQITPDREPMPTLGLSSEGMTSASGKPAEGKSDAGKSNAAKSRDAKSGAKQSTDSKNSPSPGAKASPGPAKSD
ncbi:MAG TPA: efflux RND transporter periplasmic adaptor subunit [Pirellulales bacterium]|nr:efflux RND transporter periplasmic adaptor subunit [Pirellulales bacterium]